MKRLSVLLIISALLLPGLVQAAVIPQSGWTLLYVDSEELVGEDGAAVNAFDGDVNTLWHTEWLRRDPPPPHEIQIDLGSVYDIDGFRYLPYQENGLIDQYAFYVSADGTNWGTAVATGSFSNDLTEKEVLFSMTTGRYVRLVALSEVNGNPWTSMAELDVLGFLSSGNQAPDGTIDTPAGDITMDVGDSVSFSGTGTDPDGNTPLTYLWNFGDPAIGDSTAEDPGAITFNNSGVFTVSFTVTDSLGLSDPTPATRTVTVGNVSLPISKYGWTLLYVDSEELVGEDGAAVNAFDGDPTTFWHTEWLHSDPQHPHEIQIDLGDVYDIDGFWYLPIQENGNIDQYEFYVSADGTDWGTAVAFGTFANDMTEKEVLFSTTTGRYVRLVALSEVNGNPWTSMAELDVLGFLSSGNQAPDGTIDTPAGNITMDVGDSVSFSGTGTDPDGNTPLTYLWNFGDPAIGDSTAEDPGAITFNNSGVFTVSFTVTDSLGLSDPTPATRTITVISSGNQSPDGTIDTPAGDITIDVGDSVSFSGTGTDPDGNMPLSFLWDFGDPAIGDSTAEDPGAITFNNPGVCTVSFTVTDSLGLSDPTPATRTVTVGNGSIPISKTGWSLLYVDSEELVGEDGAAVNAFDGDSTTFWHTEWLHSDPSHPHEIQIDLGDIYDIDGFWYLPIQENGNIDQYEFYVSADGIDWGTAVASGSFAHDMTEKEVLFSTTTGRYVRLVALSEVNGNAWTSMAELSILGSSSSGNQSPDGTIDTPAGDITINVGDSINFSGTGIDPDGNMPLTFLWDFGDPAITDATVEEPEPITFNNSGVFTVSFTVTDSLGLSDPTPATRTVTVGNGSSPISNSGWTLLYVDSEELIGEDGAGVNAFDGDLATFWHTEWLHSDPPHPHEIQIDLGDIYDIDGFWYLPIQENGNIDQYEFYVSADGIAWGNAVASGSFAHDMTEKEVLFSTTMGRYVRLVALSEVNGNPWTSMAELSVLGSLSSGNQAPDGTIDTPAGNITINVGDSVNFSGTGIDQDGNTPLTFLWDFGDPAITDATVEDPGAITFNNPGVFTVGFTVTDSLGLSDPTPATRTITVTDVWGEGYSIYVAKVSGYVKYRQDAWPDENHGINGDIRDALALAGEGGTVIISGGSNGVVYTDHEIDARKHRLEIQANNQTIRGAVHADDTLDQHTGAVVLESATDHVIYNPGYTGVLLNNLKISGGVTPSAKYGIYDEGQINTEDVTIDATGMGVMISSVHTVTHKRLTIKNCVNSSEGRGICMNDSGTSNFFYCVVDGNKSEYAIYATQGTINLYNCLIIGNEQCAVFTAGSNPVVNITNSIFSSNIMGFGDKYLIKNTTVDGTINIGTSVLLPHPDRTKTTDYTKEWFLDRVTVSEPDDNIYVVPQFRVGRYPGILVLSVDDAMNFEYWKNVADECAIRGFRATFFINTGSFKKWSELQTYIDAGHEAASHTRWHSHMTDFRGLEIKYTGSGTACLMNIDSNSLITAVTGGPGGENLNIDFLNWNYIRLGSLAGYINSLPSYDCSVVKNLNDYTRSKCLADILGQDIKTSSYTCMFNSTKLYDEELTNSKADIENNLTGYVCKTYTSPGNATNETLQDELKDRNYLGARGSTHSSCLLEDCEVYNIRMNEFYYLTGKSDIERNTAAYCEWLNYVGGISVLYAHNEGEFSIANWQKFLDTVATSNVTVMTFAEAIEHIRNIRTGFIPIGIDADGDGERWTRTISQQPDYRLKATSPCIDAGTDLGLTEDFARAPVPYGGVPDIGIYEYIPAQ